MKIIAVIQARLNSTRLPNKMLAILDGKTILQHVIDFALDIPVDTVVLATPDEELRGDARSNKIAYYLQDPQNQDDVLERFLECGRIWRPDYIVRICADNVFLSRELAKKQIEIVRNDGQPMYDFYHYVDETYSALRYSHFVEIVSYGALMDIYKSLHEHIVQPFYYPWAVFKIKIPDRLIACGKEYHLGIDTQVELDQAKKIFQHIPHRPIEWQDVCDLKERGVI